MNNPFQKHWQSLQQQRWAKEWNALPLDTLAETDEGEKVREKAHRLIQKGLKATDERLLKALSQGWILALSEGVDQRGKNTVALWPRNKAGQTLLHMMAKVKDRQLSYSDYGAARIRNNWTHAILGYATQPSTTYVGNPNAHQKVLWNQADHQGITPLMVAMHHAIPLHFDEADWSAKDHQGQTAWHHWAQGVLEVTQHYRRQDPSGTQLYYKLERDLSPWLKKLELCQTHMWYTTWDGLDHSRQNKQHVQCQDALQEVDSHGQSPLSMLVKGLTQREFIAIFCQDLDTGFQWKRDVPFGQTIWRKEEIKTMINQGYFSILDKTDVVCALSTYEWTAPAQGFSKINPQSVLQRIFTHSMAWRWLTATDEEYTCALDKVDLWKKEDHQGPLYLRLEKWAAKSEAHQKLIQPYEGWKTAKIEWEQEHFHRTLPREESSSKRSSPRL